MKKIMLLNVLVLFLVIMSVSGSVLGQGPTATPDEFVLGNDVAEPPANQIIIKFTGDAAENSLLAADVNGELPRLSAEAGVELTYFRPMSGDAHVLQLPDWTPIKEVEQMAADLTALPGVEYAEPDRIKTIDVNPEKRVLVPSLIPNDTIPNDTRWNEMWHLRYAANTSEGMNLVLAWDISQGEASTVVAVIDTGILAHTDLAGKTVPGYDFITDVAVANDGNGRDSNPADPGDWIAANECFAGSDQSDSSWHGTHVAGTIGAASNNNLGITGVNWNAKILPVRVLGKCGGTTSDIVDAMRWSAGLSVVGVPNNANPADVLNLSLGGSGACEVSQQNAIDAIVAAGTTVVVAAGNSNANASNFTPANCNNVITVAATDRTGDRAFYSNYGSVVEVSGPGGETTVSANGILSTLDSGLTTPNNDNSYAFYQGTSMATPHVAGLASLIKGMRPGYTPAQVLSLLQSTARSFPAGSGCNTSICGSGIVDAYQALNQLNVTFTDFVYLPAILRAEPPVVIIPIANPSFESGPTGWTESSTHGWPIILGSSNLPEGVTPHSGSWAAWLGGEYDDISYVQQQVTVPAATPYLTYWHWIASGDVCGWDFGGVMVNGSVVDQYELCQSQNTGGWVKHSVNLSAYAGQVVTFQVRVETDSDFNSNLFVDDFSFQASVAVNSPITLLGDVGETASEHKK